MEKNNSKSKELIKTIIELVAVAVVTSLIFTKVVNPVIVNGKSMYPTLDNNDISIINVIGLSEDSLERFDVVVLYSTQLQEKIVKRLIGFPGETIQFKDDRLYIDGVEYEETYLDKEYMEEAKLKYNSPLFTEDFEVTVPENEYFVMGDNRLVSADSRVLGSFPYDKFIGKDGVILFPFNHVKTIK
ncbi:MAG: signal peptidase I [Beduini sp.]|uniref:signal peptidase I n=1 Tax=Beduini sp. TaxID=1922300 RepID=UPI0011C957B5